MKKSERKRVKSGKAPTAAEAEAPTAPMPKAVRIIIDENYKITLDESSLEAVSIRFDTCADDIF